MSFIRLPYVFDNFICFTKHDKKGQEIVDSNFESHSITR
jgi:hypothetical protein